MTYKKGDIVTLPDYLGGGDVTVMHEESVTGSSPGWYAVSEVPNDIVNTKRYAVVHQSQLKLKTPPLPTEPGPNQVIVGVQPGSMCTLVALQRLNCPVLNNKDWFVTGSGVGMSWKEANEKYGPLHHINVVGILD